MSVEHRRCWEREHSQLQLQGPCSAGSPVPPGGWLTLLPRAELTQKLSKGIFAPVDSSAALLVQEVALGTCSRLSRGNGELSALSSCPEVGDRGHGCSSHPALLFPLP